MFIPNIIAAIESIQRDILYSDIIHPLVKSLAMYILDEDSISRYECAMHHSGALQQETLDYIHQTILFGIMEHVRALPKEHLSTEELAQVHKIFMYQLNNCNFDNIFNEYNELIRG